MRDSWASHGHWTQRGKPQPKRAVSFLARRLNLRAAGSRASLLRDAERKRQREIMPG